MWIDMTSSRSPLYRHVNWESVLAFGAGLALAALARDSVLSTFSVMAGAYVAWWFHRQHRSRQSAVAPVHLERLVWQLRAVYPLLPSAMDALEVSAAKLPEGKLRQTAEECVSRYRAATLTAHGTLPESLKPLYDLGDPDARHLAFILERTGLSEPAAIYSALAELDESLRVQHLLRDWAWLGLFIVNLTRRVLEAVLVGAVALALTMPNTRMFYTGSLAARCVLMAFTVFGTALCLRLEAEARQVDAGSS
jgi:hypothetical protein